MVLSFINLSFLFHTCFLHFLCLSYLDTASAIIMRNNETDRLALLDFKSKITSDPSGVLSSWNTSLHFCQWYGIRCGRKHQRATALRLPSLKLSGSISPHIANLSFLRVLVLENNSLTHQIPPQIGHLNKLQVLYLNNNSISGQIPPALSNCSNMLYIDLSVNKLDGRIPHGFGSLMKLKELFLGRNRIVGKLPTSLGNLSALVEIQAQFNNLYGVIPHNFAQLKNLTFVSLYANAFSGQFPFIFNLSLIQAIDLQKNNLKGNLPAGLGISLPNLLFFSVSFNQFSGTIPTSFSNASNLEVLQLVSNDLTGTVPYLNKLFKLRLLYLTDNHLGSGETDNLEFLSSLTNATNFQAFSIGSNNFKAKLPHYISNFSRQLQIFDIESNQIFGNIDDGIGALANLAYFGAGHNALSGSIPSSIGKLQVLQRLFLRHNHFTETIPFSLGNLTNLTILDASHNDFHGNLPSSLGNYKNLLFLDFSSNNLSGDIPFQIFGISSLSISLNLSNNRLSGTLPDEVGNLKNLGILDLSGNRLSGKLPTSIGSCTSIEILYMGENMFQGSIPSSLGFLRAIQELNLSYNNFSGNIPEFLKGFKLIILLDLSYNDFEGIVPTDGVFKNASATFVVGNEKLCGGIPIFKLPSCEYRKPNKRLTKKLKIIISLALIMGSASLALISLFLWYSKTRKSESASKWDGNSLLKVSYLSLFKATDGFSSNNLIGAGSFGNVYKGILDQEGATIAVKVLNLMHRGASKSFIAECEALKHIRHRNLVKVLTACSSIDHGGKDFKALVYEFMVNGSLDDWLHPIFRVDQVPKTLNFLQRLNIAIDVACALEYLHHHCETPIAHCDLKPSNILLDEEMTAKVSDFGLAKFLPSQIVESSTNESSSIGVRGTIGYCPPEYGIESKVSIVGDIFSYGVILLEIFSGKRPTDEMFNDGTSLHCFAKRALPERVFDIIDPNLLQVEHTPNFSERVKESLISIFEIGILCSSESPRGRMKIGNVVAQLSSIRKKLQNRWPSQYGEHAAVGP